MSRPVKGISTRERQETDGQRRKSLQMEFVVERMHWVKKDGLFRGSFDWVRYDRDQEWTADGHRMFHNPPDSLYAFALKSGVLQAIPQDFSTACYRAYSSPTRSTPTSTHLAS